MLPSNKAWDEVKRDGEKLRLSLKIAPMTEHAPDNKYGMKVSIEQSRRDALVYQKRMNEIALRQAQLQQQAELQKYAHGWHDPRASSIVAVRDAIEEDLNKLLWNTKPLRPHQYAIAGAVLLIIVAIILKVAA